MAQQQSQPSPMSITQLCNATPMEDIRDERQRSASVTSSSSGSCSIDHNDPDVRLAAEALGDMANAKTDLRPITLPPLSTYASAPSTSPSSPLPTPTSSSLSHARCSFSSDVSAHDEDYQRQRQEQQQQQQQQPWRFPLVNSALRAYQNTKESNGVVKYGVEMVESFAAPIYDKFGRRAPSESPEFQPLVAPETEQEDEAALAAAKALARASLNDTYEPPQREGVRRRRAAAEDTRDDRLASRKPRSRPASRSTSPHRPYSLSATKPTAVRHRPEPISRSRWQQIVMHAGSAAGTTAAVISEESMKCLRYCLYWLEYATKHIEQQMQLLRNFLVSLAVGSSQSKAVATPSTANSTLTAIKKEIIDTLRKVVDVVSRYAGTGLPEQAKASVRKFILALPGRWATLSTSSTASPASSPALGPQGAPDRVHETSIKLLTFGDESIEMLRSVSTVFSDTIERAELWLQRLRVVGVAGTSSGAAAAANTQNKAEQTRSEDNTLSTTRMDTT
ncbi:hypothetical protein VTP01DRAFT_2588 [Rhizomucor pusillus]|uniref:uncharacterized protein n=1 Tax=Rhizomucor pusillus TaxID=4840 RepID=UPI0037439F23